MRGPINAKFVERFTLYLPECDRYGNPIPDRERWLDEAVIVLCSVAGGVTIMPKAEGAWLIEETGQMIREPVCVLHAAVDPQRFDNQKAIVLEFMERFGHATLQDTVAAEYQGKMILIKIEYGHKSHAA